MTTSSDYVPSPDVFEKLASFYLGRHFDLDSNEMTEDLLMYDAKDLCTHAMCVGMTGSGKTGLCLSLLEEAAIDGIPAICVDPKGDLANLMLTFPDLEPSDFQEWLEEGEATRKGVTLDELGQQKAKLWKDGLASWGQDGQRIQKLKDAVDVAIYTPGSNIGLPMTVLKSFDAPPPEARGDTELIGDRVTGAVSGLLTLMGIDADPMTSPEHILLSSILSHQWTEGKNVGIGQLIRLIQSPPIKRIGVVDLDSFMSASDRGKLAMRLNNLLASPAFASWLEGEGLSIKRLLHTPEGKPRLTILSIAHLNDSERMFFVTILLNELVAWMRTQQGTSSLRAMFYMDEVAGYFPPVKNPPSKPPMLTLLKQARAFGLGITLVTQNPVDLDYKGLSNIGTWFLGRLQTERDKARVLEGLEGAAGQAGQKFDRGKMEQVLAGLGNRVFLMNNVHDGFPTVFQTRWAMSFLAGPLARGQISDLMKDKKAALAATGPSGDAASAASEPEEPQRPVVPAGIEERFIGANLRAAKDSKLVYRPALYAEGSMHFIRKTANLDSWQDAKRIIPCYRGFPDDGWESSEVLPSDVELLEEPEEDYRFSALPDELLSKGKYRTYKSEYKDYLYRHCSVTLYNSPLAKGYAPVGDESDAKAHFRHLIHEQRDEAIDKLRDKYESKLKSLEKKMQTAADRIEREKGQSRTSMISAGSSILGALLGGFLGGRRTGVSTVARGVGYATQQGDDVRRAEDAMRVLEDDRDELNEALEEDIDTLKEEYDTDRIELDETEIPPRKSDLKVETPLIVWMPWQVDASGIAAPLY
ncbi:MAG: ATP-binding protein [Rubripirellula sp.]